MATTTDKISAIVPSFNHGQYIGEAISSVLKQTTPVEEVLVIDDASSDDSLEKIRRFSDPRIRILTSEKISVERRKSNHGLATKAFTLPNRLARDGQ